MDIRFCGNNTPGNPAEGICDEYRLSAIERFDELLDAWRKLGAEHPGHHILLSLDDPGQARYTSGHVRNNLYLDEVKPQDLVGLPAECFEKGEHIGYLTTKAEFPICLRNFMALVADVSFADACAFGLTLSDESLQEWIDYQAQPLSLLDQPLLALVVPVEHASQALAAFPNGYFEPDLGPAHNHAVAQRFFLQHGYALLGVGASYLGFVRAEPASPAVAQALAEDLCALYNTDQAQRPARLAAFAGAIIGCRHLWLRYVE
ncbi:hypothetical protein IFR09_26080 [Pseudomonas syringae]|nr:hypothetical protein [Pseudomonas syringae]MBD8576023.1 hypothetical protein [Pseudomonas syringae]MBD8790794.1 hypothetical protein [Pseudomonas syringae]MBD8802071.1 hypothetical protein [Pseudomonas syringae]MBD8814637.1 hypothetical protein [Pseudomonas syringae]